MHYPSKAKSYYRAELRGAVTESFKPSFLKMLSKVERLGITSPDSILAIEDTDIPHILASAL